MNKPKASVPDWIREYGVNALARKIGVDPSAVSRWASEKTNPTLSHALEILRISNGKLNIKDFRRYSK